MELNVNTNSAEEIDAVVKRMTELYTEQYHNKEITKEELDELVGYVHLWAERKRQGKLQ
jgi:hypothetical protein